MKGGATADSFGFELEFTSINTGAKDVIIISDENNFGARLAVGDLFGKL